MASRLGGSRDFSHEKIAALKEMEKFSNFINYRDTSQTKQLNQSRLRQERLSKQFNDCSNILTEEVGKSSRAFYTRVTAPRLNLTPTRPLYLGVASTLPQNDTNCLQISQAKDSIETLKTIQSRPTAITEPKKFRSPWEYVRLAAERPGRLPDAAVRVHSEVDKEWNPKQYRGKFVQPKFRREWVKNF